MKKINKIFTTFLLAFIFFSLASSFASADTTVWNYTETQISKIHGSFTTLDACNTDLALFKQNHIGSSVTDCISSTVAGLPLPTAVTQTPTSVSAIKTPVTDPGTYTLLAPIGDMSTIQTTDLGKYINTMIQIIIGICAALAVIYIVLGGIQWMGGESVFDKAAGKDKITNAILGLLIAIGSYAILNTINPDLLGKNGLAIDQAIIEIVDKPDAGDRTVDPDFKNQTGSYSTSMSISPEVVSSVQKLKSGMTINSFNINVASKKMSIKLNNGSSTESSGFIDIDIGQAKPIGYSEIGKGVTGDLKTPKGSWQILEIRTSKDNKPVFNKTGSNMGASFWLLSPTNSGDRGIGMHGSKNGTLIPTSGCIRLKNSDILSLLPYVKAGIPVIIQ